MTQPEIDLFAPDDEDDIPPTTPPKRRRRWIVHAIVWPLLAIVIIGGGFAAWFLYSDAMAVRADLEEARTAVSDFQSAATDRRLDDLQPIADRLATSSERPWGRRSSPSGGWRSSCRSSARTSAPCA